MVCFMSGKKLPLIEAMEQAYERNDLIEAINAHDCDRNDGTQG